jgi:hypothetical protein
MTGAAAQPDLITGVALLREDGAMWALPAPCRHFHLFALAALQGTESEPCTQGFVTSAGVFVDRVEALAIAKAAGQRVNKNGSPKELYSEDLW